MIDSLKAEVTTKQLIETGLRKSVADIQASNKRFEKLNLDQKITISTQKIKITSLEKNVTEKNEKNSDIELKLEKNKKKIVKHLEKINFLSYSAFSTSVQYSAPQKKKHFFLMLKNKKKFSALEKTSNLRLRKF